MLGNDVVDLRDPETRAENRHRRFDRRVFAPDERALVDASRDGERLRWLLWAAKESAYKALRKEDRAAVFAPARFVVRLEAAGRASVEVARRRFHVEVDASGARVHAVAWAIDDRPGRLCTAVASLDAQGVGATTPSERVRRLAVHTIARAFRVAAEDLAIRRDGRIPTLWWRGRPSSADLSLSHHGRFVAFACAPPHDWGTA